jgi:hypothetical protein
MVDENGERLKKILAGAFSGPPTPLKAIPKKDGGSRAASKKSRASDASAKSARPKP